MNRVDLLDGGYLFYGRGRFDDWCVFFVNSNGYKSVPKDVDYFRELLILANKWGNERIYNDFVKIYDLTTNSFDNIVVDKIREVASTYSEDCNSIFRIFVTIYMAMISEENKSRTVLGKRIKRLGVYYLLCKNCSVNEAATFSNGKSAHYLGSLCKDGGF